LRILLVGGLGFIGKHIIRTLTDSNVLLVFENAETATRNQGFAKSHGLRVEVGDITNGARAKDVALLEKPDVVIHLAALTGIAKCNQNPSLAFATNVLGTYNVAMACMAAKSKLIFISSREVYGETASGQTREDDPLVPNNIYGLTKMLGEKLVLWAASRSGLDYTILRLTNVYGPEGEQYNVQAMIRKATTEGRIQILGGSQRMNLIYVEDVAEVVRKCLNDPSASRQTFNVGSKDDMPIEEVVCRLISALNIPVEIVQEPMRTGETLNFCPNLDRIERVLEWHARTTFDEGLKRTIEWHKERRLQDPNLD